MKVQVHLDVGENGVPRISSCACSSDSLKPTGTSDFKSRIRSFGN